ncbi:hypothetical protein [Microvirga vignae]|uniref:hypothetical protein n=1 Tax=Microvirga vignae TaxID=1225564 RepID=UPI00063FEB03|nr:hypothetical protein [Microvirga vignae]
MSHKFRIRQMVRLKQSGFSNAQTSATTIYEVVRLMPADPSGEVSYRIKSGPFERAVRESEIRGA